MLLEKFVKLYGLSNPKAVKTQIDKFFKKTKNVNAKALLKLEDEVKKEAIKHKSITTKKKSVKAPKVEFVEEIEQEQETQQMPCRKQAVKKLIKKENSDTESSEDEDWDKVANYKAYI